VWVDQETQNPERLDPRLDILYEVTLPFKLHSLSFLRNIFPVTYVLLFEYVPRNTINRVSRSQGGVGGGLIPRAAMAFDSQKFGNRREVHGSTTHSGTDRQGFPFQVQFGHPQLCAADGRHQTSTNKQILGVARYIFESGVWALPGIISSDFQSLEGACGTPRS